MKTITSALTIVALATVLTGCAVLDPALLDPIGITGKIREAREQRMADQALKEKEREEQSDHNLLMQRMNITTRFATNPDTDAWKEQRAKISQAAGERVFSKDYSHVFDSLVVAVSSLEMQVNNMERQSGYITASRIGLSPGEAKTLRRQAMNDWCVQNGFDPSILDQQYHSSTMGTMTEMTDMGNMMAKSDKLHRALTFRIDNLGESRTRVTLRFSEVHYPGELEAYYRLVWNSVDKQIFIDQNIDGNVAKRQ